MKTHPLANLFPEMPVGEFAALKADIAEYGVREAVWMWRGQLLDGRHRRRACEELGIKCPTREWDGSESEVAAFIVSLNLHRRHLDESQRAMVAARLANMRQGERTDLQPSANLPKVSSANAAEMLNVAERSVTSARKVIDSGTPELVKAVESGAVPVSVAAKIAELTPQRQTQVIEKATSTGNLRGGLVEAAKNVPRLKNADSGWTPSEKERRTAVKSGRTVVAHINDDARLVEWAEEQGLFLRVDRGTEWGNPYLLGDDGDRDTVIESFSIYLKRKYGLRSRFHCLRGKVLGCWCYPNLCHADVLVREAKENHEQDAAR